MKFAQFFPLLLLGSAALPLMPANAQSLSVALFQENSISTPKNEFNPTLTADGKTMYLVHSLPGFLESKIMVSKLIDDTWTNPERISFSDDRYRDSDPSISPDGKTLYFISNRPIDGGIEPKKDYDIWKAEHNGKEWSKPEPIKEVNSLQMELGVEYWQGALYFNSTRGGTATSSDIYYSRLENGKFSAPISIGSPINTAEFEADPCISPDGQYLVFSAWNREGSLGQGDLYISRKDGNGWSEPVSLGNQINSEFFEFTPFFSLDGQYLYFSSDKHDASQPVSEEQILNGKFNVYRVAVPELLKSISFKAL